MKVYEAALLALFGLAGCYVYSVSLRISSDAAIKRPAPQVTPGLKPEKTAGTVAGRVDFGTLRRLSPDQFKPTPETVEIVTIRPAPPKKTVSTPVTPPRTVTRPKPQAKPRLGLAPPGVPSKLHPPKPRNSSPSLPPGIIMAEPGSGMQIHSLTLDRADNAALKTIDLSLPVMAEADPLFSRVVNMAEASPVQPSTRGCGTAVLEKPKSANNVNAVGYQRDLTSRTTIGLEYVYNDGCYQNAITPINSLDMPADDGVNIRVNMRF